MRTRGGERVLGPYEQHNGWRVVRVYADGRRKSRVFESEREAELYMASLLEDLARDRVTVETALEQYRAHMIDKGNKPGSVKSAIAMIGMLLVDGDVVLGSLTPQRCAAAYEALRTTPREATGKPPAADTQRQALALCKTFLRWCVERGWIDASPFESVKAIGKLRPRGKSLGKSGVELRVREARAFYATAVALADTGNDAAIASLVALLLGMRANEIVAIRVADVDDDQAPGDLLWIPCSKTPAGRRTLEVPEVLRELLVRSSEGKAPERHLFETAKGKPHPSRWVRRSVHRVCDAAGLPHVTAHGLRGLLATLTAERGMAGNLIAAMLGHSDSRLTMRHYAAPGSQATGVNRRGLVVLNGGVQVRSKSAK